MCLRLNIKKNLSKSKIEQNPIKFDNAQKETKETKNSKRHDKDKDGMIDSIIQSDNEELYMNQSLPLILSENFNEENKQPNEKFFNLMIYEYISINKDVIDSISSLTSKTVKYLHKKRLEERGYRMTNKKLGEGGYGIVYKIYLRKNDISSSSSCSINQPLACKIMLLSSKKDKGLALENYSNEVYTMKCSKHTNIVSIRDHFVYSHAMNAENIFMSHSYIIMEYAQLGTLWAKLKKQGPFGEHVSRGYFQQMANGLLHLHLQGIAHRDLKLGNILLTRSEKCQEIVKLADFGLSRLVNSKESGLIRFSKPAGTLAYMSPQILTSYINNNTSNYKFPIHSYDPFKADIWALGVCFYLLLSKQHPFDNPPANKPERIIFARKMLERQMKKEWQLPNNLETNITPWSISLLDKLFEPTSRKRINIYNVIKCFETDDIKSNNII